MATSDYLRQLQKDKSDLVDNLTTKGITGLTGDETFTELVPEVLNIPSSGKYAPRYISFYMYQGADLNEELANLDTSNITSMPYMFSNILNITSLDLSNFDTRNVITMQGMFKNMSRLTNLNVSNFNTSYVENMQGMFENDYSLENLDLSSFDTSHVTRMDQMFSGCQNLNKLDIRNFIFNARYYLGMFNDVPDNCLIIVKDETQKQWMNTNYSRMTNVKTVEEYEE